MKSITVIMVLMLVACNKYEPKQQLTTGKVAESCYRLDRFNMIGDWEFIYLQYPNEDPIEITMEAVKYLTITSDSMYNGILRDKWTNEYCNVIDQGGDELIKVDIILDTMTFTGLNSGCVWKLIKN